ncbi:protein fuzzy homolog [Ciona intestinalis]
MAEHILCITASGGIPLLTRTKPGCSPLSFPVVGALNGVHMFAANRDVKLLSTLTGNKRIVWKVFQDSIVLIAIVPSLDAKMCGKSNPDDEEQDAALILQDSSRNSSSTITDAHVSRLLENVFHSLVFLTGLQELTNIQNVDRLKKDLRSCNSLIDTYLDTGEKQKQPRFEMFGDLTQCVDVMLHEDAKLLEEHLTAFAEAADSTYGCLVNNGQVVCATAKWWLLTGLELALLSRLINTLSSSITSCDIPIYLPHSSPNIAHRLLVFTLVSGVGLKSGVRVCVLCGPQPSLTQVQETLLESFWRSAMNTLQRCAHSHTIPDPLIQTLPSPLLGFLLVDTENRRCVSLMRPSSGDADHMSRRKQQKNEEKFESSWIFGKLTEFYKFVVGTSLPLPETIEDEPYPGTVHDNSHIGLCHYRCLKRHKAFALVRSQYQLFAVYSNTAPTFALQGLTNHAMDVLLKDRLL